MGRFKPFACTQIYTLSVVTYYEQLNVKQISRRSDKIRTITKQFVCIRCTSRKCINTDSWQFNKKPSFSIKLLPLGQHHHQYAKKRDAIFLVVFSEMVRRQRVSAAQPPAPATATDEKMSGQRYWCFFEEIFIYLNTTTIIWIERQAIDVWLSRKEIKREILDKIKRSKTTKTVKPKETIQNRQECFSLEGKGKRTLLHLQIWIGA